MFGFVFNWPMLVGNLVLVGVAGRIGLNVRIIGAFIIILVVCFSMPLASEFLPKETGWYVLMVLIAINGFGNSIEQAGLFGLASMFPKKYMVSMMVGQSINGVMLNSVKVLLLVLLPPKDDLKDKDMNVFYDSIIFLCVFSIIITF